MLSDAVDHIFLMVRKDYEQRGKTVQGDTYLCIKEFYTPCNRIVFSKKVDLKKDLVFKKFRRSF